MSNNQKKKVIIIGSGLGGIATALRLSYAGHEVTICEKNSILGGKIGIHEEKGFIFDLGPSLITLPQFFKELFHDIGLNIHEYLTLKKLDPICNYKFPDGTNFEYSSSLSKMTDEIEKKCLDNPDKFFKFIDLGSKIFSISEKTFLNYPLSKFPKISFGELLTIPLIKSLKFYNKVIDHYFKDPKLRQIYYRYPTYVGSSPFSTPGIFSIIPYLEFAFGGWYIKGGIYNLVSKLEKIMLERKITIMKKTEIIKIIHKNKKIVGVKTKEKNIFAEIVVFNGDVNQTKNLLDNTEKNETKDLSLSGFVILAGLNNQNHELSHHNILFSENYNYEFHQLFKEKVFPDEPTIYISAPHVSDNSVAPKNCSNLFIMANAPAGLIEWNDKEIEIAKSKIYNQLEKHKIIINKNNLIVEKILSPKYFEINHNSLGGSLYGINSHGYKNALIKPRNKSDQFSGLYFVGGTVHPGGGTPTVLKSAKITSELIKNDH